LNTTKFFLLVASLLAALPSTCSAVRADTAAEFALHDGDRVVMYGDSITDQRLYTQFTETYVTTRFPSLKIDWTDSGWGGDRVGGGGGGPIDVRIKRDIEPYNPTMVTIMLAMNDGGYKPFDQPTFDVYSKGYAHIVDTLRKDIPGVHITLIQPSPYDDVTRAPKFDGGYNAVLVKYGASLPALAKPGDYVADFNSPMVAMLQKANSADAAAAATIIPDRVHPSPSGHLVMAESLLKAWNAPSLVTAVTLDAAGKSVTQSANATVTNPKFVAIEAVVNGIEVTPANATVTNPKFVASIEWDELDSALPFPIDATAPTTALVLKSSDLLDALDQETLKVTGLTAAKY
jgi:lysophospholipase L1-like esterase